MPCTLAMMSVQICIMQSRVCVCVCVCLMYIIRPSFVMCSVKMTGALDPKSHNQWPGISYSH